MDRGEISLDEQINRQETVVLKMKKQFDDLKAKYDAEIEKMAKLVEQKRNISRQEIIKLLDTTTRTDDEIIAFLKNENPDEEDE